jgi:hypothetical protein
VWAMFAVLYVLWREMCFFATGESAKGHKRGALDNTERLAH